MVNGIRTSDPHGLNKRQASKFHEDFWVRQTPEEGWRTYQLKHCEYNNKDFSLKTLNDKTHQAFSLKFRQLIIKFHVFL